MELRHRKGLNLAGAWSRTQPQLAPLPRVLPSTDNIPQSGVVSKRSVDVPQICQERVQGYGMNEASTGITCNGLEAMEVQYDDCGEPWTLCRCGDAQVLEPTPLMLAYHLAPFADWLGPAH